MTGTTSVPEPFESYSGRILHFVSYAHLDKSSVYDAIECLMMRY